MCALFHLMNVEEYGFEPQIIFGHFFTISVFFFFLFFFFFFDFLFYFFILHDP